MSVVQTSQGILRTGRHGYLRGPSEQGLRIHRQRSPALAITFGYDGDQIENIQGDLFCIPDVSEDIYAVTKDLIFNRRL